MSVIGRAVIPNKSAGNAIFKRLNFTIANDITSTAVVIQNDPWLTAHYNDPYLNIALYRKASPLPSVGAMCYILQANYAYCRHGMASYFGTGAMPRIIDIYPAIYETEGLAPKISVSDTGDLSLYGNSSYIFTAGDYEMVAWIASS